MTQTFGGGREILNTPNLRVGIYNRCSTTKEAQTNALEVQVKESKRIAEELGWVITGHYVEQKTGTSTKHREEYKRMLNDIALDKFDVIMAKSQDRLMRNNREWYELIEMLTKYKKQLYLYLDNMVYDCDDNGFLLGIMMQLHAQYSRNLSVKIREAHEIRQREKSGLNITSPMYGWDKVGKDQFVVNEEEAYYYRKAYEMLRNGLGYRTIANRMYHEFGVVSKKTGKQISQTQWRNMLTSPRACGTMILRKNTKPFGTEKRDKVPEEEQIVIENALPPIVSKEYYMETMKIIRERTSNFYPERDLHKVGRYQLSGKIYCKECGEVFYRATFKKGSVNRTIWKCKKKFMGGGDCQNIIVDENQLLKLVEHACNQHFDNMFKADKDIISEALVYIKKVLKNNDITKQLEKLEDRRNRQRKKKQVLFDKLMEEVIDDADFKIQNDKLTKEIKELTEEIEGLSEKTKVLTDYEHRLARIREELTAGDIIEKAKAYGYLKLIDKIIVGRDKSILIRLNQYKINDLLGIYTIHEVAQAVNDANYEIRTTYEYQSVLAAKKEKTKSDILELFRENDRYQYTDIMEKLGITYSYVAGCIRELKSEGRLKGKRLGNERAVQWIVNDNLK